MKPHTHNIDETPIISQLPYSHITVHLPIAGCSRTRYPRPHITHDAQTTRTRIRRIRRNKSDAVRACWPPAKIISAILSYIIAGCVCSCASSLMNDVWFVGGILKTVLYFERKHSEIPPMRSVTILSFNRVMARIRTTCTVF